MKTRVLDSWAILEWLSGRQPAADAVDLLFSEAERGSARLLLSATNVGEVYCFLMKHHAQDIAESWRDSASTLPATIEVPSAEDIWAAATLKGRFPIASADAFAAALAQKHHCPLVTGDPEFRTVTNLEIEWIGRKRVRSRFSLT